MAKKAGENYINAQDKEVEELEKLYNQIKITVPEEETKVSLPNNENKKREGNELEFTWAQLSEISTIIENTLKDNIIDNDITFNTNEFKLYYQSNEYTIGVGDYKYIQYDNNYYKVQILGFNHDILAGQNITSADGDLRGEYRDTSNNNQLSEVAYNHLNKAGITFEFVDCLMMSNMYKVGSSTEFYTDGGWSNRQIRYTLNGKLDGTTKTEGIIDSMTEINNYVKRVTKPYGATYSNGYISYVEDKMWLQSCAEIWGNVYQNGTPCVSGSSKSMEGKQYKYYKNIAPIYGNNSQLIKTKNTSPCTWWLRSLSYHLNYSVCSIRTMGEMGTEDTRDGYCIFPCFSI